LFLCLGLGGLTLAVGSGEYGLVFVSQSAVGAGFGLCWGTLSQLLMNVSTIEERDKTSALLPTLQSAGYAIGAAVFGAVANAGGFAEGVSARVISTAMLSVFALGCVLAAASLFFGIRTLRLARCEGRAAIR
jgi:hypothetical protein